MTLVECWLLSQVRETWAEKLRAWPFCSGSWEGFYFNLLLGLWSRCRARPGWLPASTSCTVGARCPGSHAITGMSQSHQPRQGTPSEGDSWGVPPAHSSFLALFTDECGSESQADYLPRLCLRCHWAPRHHPTECHSRLWRGASKTGMTGMASSLCSPFLDVPWRDLAPPYVHECVPGFCWCRTLLCVNIFPNWVCSVTGFALPLSPCMCLNLNYML